MNNNKQLPGWFLLVIACLGVFVAVHSGLSYLAGAGSEFAFASVGSFVLSVAIFVGWILSAAKGKDSEV